MTNEELVMQIKAGDEKGYEELLFNLQPMIMKIARKHLSSVPIYDEDDYTQEGLMIMWKIISTMELDPGCKFSTLFYTVFDRRCINLYRNYVLKNFIMVSEAEDFYCYGYHIGHFVEAEFAVEYRQKKRQWDLAERKKKNPDWQPKPKPTEEEIQARKERQRQKAREYYWAHREEYRMKRKKWYQEHHEYALAYQKAYDHGVRIGRKGPA